tara:strand:- start:15897 stop:16523 length:627 start_codon:yes stop_codon:yes gene_type:complete
MEIDVQSQETEAYSTEDQQILEGKEPQEEGQQEQLIGGKFKTADDLLEAYQNLERRLGQSDKETPVQETEEVESKEDTTEEVKSGLREDQENSIVESVGGLEDFARATDWAKSELDQDEIDSYNREVNSGDYIRARNAIQSLKYAYQNATGTEPNLLGGKVSNNNTDVFRSTAEVETAMNDPRYLHDAAYTRDVEEKMNRSDILTPRF